MNEEPTRRRSTAEPVTAVVAERVRVLRTRRGLSQGDLAEALNKLGVPWKRATVVNLEARSPESRSEAPGRDALTLQEFLALAVVLDVPPPMLIADPRLREPVPITDELRETPWNVLQWMVGIKKLVEPDPNASEIIWAAWEIYEATVRLPNPAASYHGYSRDEIKRLDERAHREEIYRIERAHAALRRHRIEPPPLHPAVLRRARELGFDEFPAEH